MPKGDKEKLKADPLDGTTPVANLLLEAVAIANLSGKEKGAILHLWRETYGWVDGTTGKRLKERSIGLAEWARVLQTKPPHASNLISGLVEKGVFRRTQIAPGKGYLYSMNTDISSWNSNSIDIEVLHKMVTLTKNGNTYQKVQVLQEPSGDATLGPKLENEGLPKKGTLTENGKGGVTQNGNTLPLVKKDIKESIKESQGAPPPVDINEQRKKVFEGLKEHRGYNTPLAGAEASAITWMLKQGYTVEQILAAHDKMAADPFWAGKMVNMQSVKKQIGAMTKGGAYGSHQKGLGGAGAHSLKSSITKPFGQP